MSEEQRLEANAQDKPVDLEREMARARYLRRMRILLPFLLVLVALVYSFAALYVPSDSMEPTLRSGDYILVMRSWLAYPGGKTPERGDTITFEAPPNVNSVDESSSSFADPQMANASTGTMFGRRQIGVFRTERPILIKRVVGLPGETIQIKGREIVVNGEKIKWPYRVFPTPHYMDIGDYGVDDPITLKSNELFVLGDNANTSDDSRIWGPLKRNSVRGRLVGVIRHARAKEGPQQPTYR